MKKIFFAIAVTIFFTSAYGQAISKVSLNRDGGFDIFSILLEENVTVTMSADGGISAWGFEVYSERIPSMSRLENFTGRVEYYSVNDNEAFRGKVKYIGKTLITYYASYDIESLRGKVKSLGTANVGYYSSYENELLKGKLKNVGPVAINWYTTYDNEAFRGKLKSVGSTTLTYYASFDDKAIAGRIKNIDRATFTYYLSTEKKEYQGMVKSGTQLQTINGIKYYVKL
ncbi:MAG: hypothetical protein ABI741_02990 [Ferruginibacter sp.]